MPHPPSSSLQSPAPTSPLAPRPGPPSPASDRAGLRVGVDPLVWIAALFWTLSANGPFLRAALQGRDLSQPAAWGFLLALLVGLLALHALLLGLLATRWTLKPVLSLLLVASAAGSFYMQRFGVVLDASMLRNVLHTDLAEAGELFTPALLLHLGVYAGLPLLLLRRVRLVQRPWRRAAVVRAGTLLGAAALLAVALLSVFQPLSSLMRNHKALRYQVTPANLLWSGVSLASRSAHARAVSLQPVGTDARPGPTWRHAGRPLLLVLMVGETARAANWGLNGYARQTTPELASLPVLNFPHVTSCGTSTEVSLPCLFAPVGRRDHDEARIRESESLLDVVQRAGVQVLWRDNQSGCKGVCDRVPHEQVRDANPAGPCDHGRCLDEGLLQGLDERLARARGVQLLVLHPLGNHGPSYFRRYPAAFARFGPACQSDDLQQCSREQIVNAYDNALLYTDHLLASLVRRLESASGTVDSALVYVSDHGESLGENGLFLHGMPYPIAPAEQTQVPMMMWTSTGFAQRLGLNVPCLAQRAQQPASHDHLFHTVLAMLDVRTSVYDPAWDLTQGCLRAAATPA